MNFTFVTYSFSPKKIIGLAPLPKLCQAFDENQYFREKYLMITTKMQHGACFEVKFCMNARAKNFGVWLFRLWSYFLRFFFGCISLLFAKIWLLEYQYLLEPTTRVCFKVFSKSIFLVNLPLESSGLIGIVCTFRWSIIIQG